MRVSELDYSFPEKLIATEPRSPSRVLWVTPQSVQECTPKEALEQIPAGDILVLNNTQVLKRRVFSGPLEILFLNQISSHEWWVLFPSKKLNIGSKVVLPLGIEMELVEKGRPQRIRTNKPIYEDYFDNVGELPLPPYIQKARNERHNIKTDETWYQTQWAQKPGSFAAPTASLHFSLKNIEGLKKRGVQVLELTLHVGLGTFLPVSSEDLDDHEMHFESVEIPKEVVVAIYEAKKRGHHIWALGTTVTRALEAYAQGHLKESNDCYLGETNLLIQPGYQFHIVERLLTNFHQPQSTLLALVAAFAGLNRVKEVYQIAIEKEFRLFSYGDLSVWIKN